MKKIATREAYGSALAALGRENSKIVVLDADLSKSTKTADFAKEFPERFFNAGIAEQNLMSVAAGLAASGKIPFVSTFAVFATGRAFEQIRNSIAYTGLGVKIAATHAGITVGEDGGSHQSVADISLMRSLPGMKVIVPCDAIETEQAVKAAAEIPGPVYLRLGRLATPAINEESYQFKLGKGTLLRNGSDVAIIACGMMTSAALEAADLLAQESIQASVANIHTVKPLDTELILELASKCKAIVTVEEHSIIGGLGSAVAEALVENCPVPMLRVGIRDIFGQSGSPAVLLEKYGLTPTNIAANAKLVMNKK